MKKIIGAWLMVAALFCTGISVFAQSDYTDIGLENGEILSFEDGDYTVYFDENGQAHLAKDGIISYGSTCPNGQAHQYRVKPGTLVKRTKLSNSSTNCYTETSYIRNVCMRCNDTVPSVLSQKTEKHKYKLTDKQCKNVVNGKRCTHKK